MADGGGGEAADGLREQRVPAEGAVMLQDQSAELVFVIKTKPSTLKKESGHV